MGIANLRFLFILSDHSSNFLWSLTMLLWYCLFSIGVLEANFLEPVHDKQGFERSSAFIRLETKLKQMVMEYWYVKFLAFLSLLSKCVWVSSRIIYQIVLTFFFLPYNFNFNCPIHVHFELYHCIKCDTVLFFNQPTVFVVDHSSWWKWNCGTWCTLATFISFFFFYILTSAWARLFWRVYFVSFVAGNPAVIWWDISPRVYIIWRRLNKLLLDLLLTFRINWLRNNMMVLPKLVSLNKCITLIHSTWHLRITVLTMFWEIKRSLMIIPKRCLSVCFTFFRDLLCETKNKVMKTCPK